MYMNGCAGDASAAAATGVFPTLRGHNVEGIGPGSPTSGEATGVWPVIVQSGRPLRAGAPGQSSCRHAVVATFMGVVMGVPDDAGHIALVEADWNTFAGNITFGRSV